MQHIETASWNSSSRPPTPIDSVEITTTSPCCSTANSDVYTVTLDANLGRRSESRECEPITPEAASVNTIKESSSPEYGIESGQSGAPHVLSDSHLQPDFQNASPFKSPRSENEDASPAKKTKTSPGKSRKGSNIAVTLEGADLWHQFYSAGTEMIITKSGR